MPIEEIRHRALHVEVSEPPATVASGSECTVFFVHGAMGSLEQWRFQTRFLKSRFRVVAFDYFGCGNSPRLHDSYESYATEEHVADLLAVFDKYKTRYNFAIGHSFGTNQVLRLARARSSELHGGVLVAPALFKDGGHPIFYLPEFVLNWMQPAMSKSFLDMALHSNTKAGHTGAHKELLQECLARSNKNSMHVAKSFYRQIKFVKREDVVAIAPTIPFVIVCGDDDKLTPLHMGKQILQWLNERADAKGNENAAPAMTKFEVVGPASHQVMEEQPEEVNKLVADFLDECLSGRPAGSAVSVQ